MKIDSGAFRFQHSLWLKLLIDALLFAAAFSLAFYWRYDVDIPAGQSEYLKALIIPVVVIKLAVFYFSRVYRISWHYASVMDFFHVAWSNVIATLAIAVLIYAAFQMPVARGVIALDGLLALAFTAGVRFSFRLFNKLRYQLFWKSGVQPVLIVGAGDTGVEIAREMLRSTRLKVRPVGFIDDDPTKKGTIVQGLSVLGTRSKLADIIAKYSIAEVIICMPAASREVIRDIFLTCQAAGVKCRTLPGIYQIIDGSVSIEQIRDVRVEDILGREPVEVDLKRLSSYIKGKVVMVIGAGGSIGSELSRQLSRMQPSSMALLDQCEEGLYEIEQEIVNRKPAFPLSAIVADITRRNRINAVFGKYKPAVVFDAAAYKHVPLMETNLVAAVENNIFGTRILCEQAVKHGVERFVFISTDKAVEPISIMGLSKAICEKVVQSFSDAPATRFMSVRFGNVLDSSGSVVPIFRRQIAQGGPVTVTHPDMIRFFMTIPEAVQLVIQAGAMGEKGEIFVLDMGEQVPIVELARNMIRLCGYEPEKDIPIEFTGIRPGEKLQEKLTWDYEESLPSGHKKISMIRKPELDKAKLQHDLGELEIAARDIDTERLKGILAHMCAEHMHYIIGPQ